MDTTKGIFLIKLTLIFLVLGESVSRNAFAQSNSPGEVSLPSLPVDSNSSELYTPSAIDPSVGESYILGVGDYLRVDVFNIPDYSGEFRILSSGHVNVPIIGAINIEGLSLQQATVQIEKSLEPYVRRPVVTLSVLETRPIQIAVSGEVHRPGSYRISSETNANSAADIPTLTQAIELAGGITQLANIRQIEVQRHLPRSFSSSGSRNALIADARSKQNKTQTVSVNLWNLLKEGDLSEDLQLQDGDRIIIPTANNLNSDEVSQLATASFSPDEIAVNVVGEVDSPGNISVPPNTPLNQAILAAGGFNNRARKATVSLVRLNLNGTVSQREIEVDFSQGINEDTNPALRPNDTVIVKRSGLARAGDTFGAVFSPLNFILRLFGI
ncbi:MAG: SLBB domain-containing protein [Cyanobacteria bacterium P01_H01_bin.105]